MDRPEPLSRYTRATAHLLAAALAPLAVAVLGLFAPLSFAELSGASWVVPAISGSAAVVLGSAMAVVLALALVGARPPAMLHAGALGALTAGLAVVAVTGALAGSGPEPSRNVAAAGAIAAAMLLAARLVPAQGEDGLGARVAVAVGVFVAAELALAATLLMALPPELVAWAYLSAAALALAASLPAISRAEALTGG
ncbi:MAG TPA: hypothetical protein VHK28_07675, partial [Candidatus Limnocylindria bacterium]|nr:hypothetical protein [Candidatus Limnocylindria bacterium]